MDLCEFTRRTRVPCTKWSGTRKRGVVKPGHFPRLPSFGVGKRSFREVFYSAFIFVFYSASISASRARKVFRFPSPIVRKKQERGGETIRSQILIFAPRGKERVTLETGDERKGKGKRVYVERSETPLLPLQNPPWMESGFALPLQPSCCG